MKTLCVDIGNSAVKAGVFDGGEIAGEFCAAAVTEEFLGGIFERFPDVGAAILSSTGSGHTAAGEYLRGRVERFVELDHTTPVPVKNLYRTPQTLGKDRLAAAVGAAAEYPGRNVLVADLGTALTMDVVTAAGEFLGGNISPGAAMRFRALNEFTARLPLGVLPENGGFAGGDTAEAIGLGVANGIKYELEGYFVDFAKEFADPLIILTGGDAIFFAKRLNYAIFVDCNLVLKGLNAILKYNAQQ